MAEEEAAPAEKFEFQAEVTRLMDIIINSLYSHKEIFLREIISNASDALDKIRFLSISDPSQLGEGDTAKLDITIQGDKNADTVSITDRGVGMTKQDLINNLGTIAKSGTSSFLEKLKDGGDVNLIGQFGVGFYSVYLVADKVTVTTKHNDDVQLVWESTADSSFTIKEDPNAATDPLGRGTRVTLHLKDDCKEFTEPDKLKELVKKYSEFINFPIMLKTIKEVEEEVPVEEGDEEEKKDGEEKKDDEEEKDDLDIKDGDDADKKKTKKVKKEVVETNQVNSEKAIWTKSSKEVEDSEYDSFYNTISKETDGPLSKMHFSAEGEIEFKSILFVPKKAPYDMMEQGKTKQTAIKLYVRRVFITDEFEDMMPRWLSFIKGVVDSEDLPLNVSREMLQTSKVLRVIKKKLVTKALEMIRKMAEKKKKKDKEDKDDKEGEKKTPSPAEEAEDNEEYLKFWKEFAKAIKLGLYEDSSNRTKLAKLLRFQTSKSGDNFTSLEKYISRMKKGQKHIYYISGENKEQVEKSPFLERLRKKDLEVLYYVDPIDEYAMPQLTEFKGFQFMGANKENLKLDDDDQEEKKL